MKKIIACIFVLTSLLLFGCGKTKEPETTTENQPGIEASGEKMFATVPYGDGLAIKKFICNENTAYSKIIVPDIIDGKPVRGLGMKYSDTNIFDSVKGQFELVLPDSLEYIGPWACYGMEGLTKVSGGNNVKEIQGYAFGKCPNLTSFDALEHIEWFSDMAFKDSPFQLKAMLYRDSAMTDPVLDDVEAYEFIEVEGGYAIKRLKSFGNNKYSKVIIPSEYNGKPVVGIGMLDGSAEMTMTNLQRGSAEIVIPDSVTYIGSGAFALADGIILVSGGKNVKTIGNGAFEGCSHLVRVECAATATSVAEDAFNGCPIFER